MKHSLLITIVPFCFCYGNASGQCLANAGPDRIICSTMNGIDTTQIGTTPAVSGGIPPYTYLWEANYTVTIGQITVTKTASDYLNDTTQATPSIVSSEDNPVTFILTVTDSMGTVCKDTAVINFSHFMFTLGYLTFYITQGDSVFLNYGANVSSNFPPFQYLWRPNQGLTDSTSLSFWSKPDSAVAYHVKLTDSAGCSIEASPYYYVIALPVGINETDNHRSEMLAYPNPANDIITINTANETCRDLVLKFFNTGGQMIRRIETNSETLKLRTDSFSKGIIYYIITEHGQPAGQGKFIVE